MTQCIYISCLLCERSPCSVFSISFLVRVCWEMHLWRHTYIHNTLLFRKSTQLFVIARKAYLWHVGDSEVQKKLGWTWMILQCRRETGDLTHFYIKKMELVCLSQSLSCIYGRHLSRKKAWVQILIWIPCNMSVENVIVLHWLSLLLAFFWGFLCLPQSVAMKGRSATYCVKGF